MGLGMMVGWTREEVDEVVGDEVVGNDMQYLWQ